MLGIWNKREGSEAMVRKKDQGGHMFVTGIRPTSFLASEHGKKPLSCWSGTWIKCPLGQLLIVRRNGGEETPHIYDQNPMTINYK